LSQLTALQVLSISIRLLESPLRLLLYTPVPLHVFFFNRTPTTEIYTLSLHELFRSSGGPASWRPRRLCRCRRRDREPDRREGWIDRKSTRLNSSHVKISYAVFCLKKKITELPKLVPSQQKANAQPSAAE